MTEFKSGPTLTFDLKNPEDAKFLFGERGEEISKQYQEAHPDVTCLVEYVDTATNMIYFAPEHQ